MRTARAGVALTHLQAPEAEAIHGATGAFILAEGTNDTVAAGMVEA
jgi:sulfate adenylyltransferase subunit 1 (EFTu-like GTPase family)